MAVILETARLVIREWETEDLEAFFAMTGDPEVMRFIGNGRDFSEFEQARKLLERIREAYKSRGWSRWAVVEKSSGEVIGSCGFSLPYGTEELDFGYYFARESWGKGYATEAGRACIAYGFERLGFDEIPASVDVENRASIRVLEKLGFRFDRLRRFDGEPEDSAMYLLKKDDLAK